MRQRHRASERLFIARSGRKPVVADPRSGLVRELELFVAVVGASNFTLAETTESRRSAEFTASHVRVFEYFGGIAALLVPHQLKNGVARACLHEPGMQRPAEEFEASMASIDPLF